MKAVLLAIWQSPITTWARNKFGRIVASIGAVLSGVEGLDITPIKDPLEKVFSHQTVLKITIVLFLLGFIRHQLVANKAGPAPAPPQGGNP